ncbi:MAG: long-chain fatty acid--CoA ligase [Alphaproteobacteria bacterium]|nr:long-chain fatty acid--CoA ligase [Alphaproteobacteria bacterium]
MNLAAHLLKTALSLGDRPAVICGIRLVRTYGELADRASALAAALRERLGLAVGDRVALVMTNHPAFLEVLYGIWWAGLAAVPINARLHAREVAYILENVGARACFATPATAETASAAAGSLPARCEVIDVDGTDYRRLFGDQRLALAEVDPTAVAWLFYTSGTTGRPKGAMLSHRNLLVMILSYFADIDWLDQRDTIVHAAPMSHASGLYGLPFVARGGSHVIPESGHFDPDELAALFRSHANVTLFAAPTMLMRLTNAPALHDHDFANLKTIHYGGGPMYVADLVKAIDLFGPRLFQIYGQGESPCTITGLSKLEHQNTSHPRYLEHLGSAGVARTDVEVRVVDADDRTLPPGEIGEVVVRGDVVMTGYWANPEASRRSLRGGWLHTGDIGVFDREGFLTLKDRANDMIISGGSNIYPREVEEVLLTHPDVLEAAVIGKPHPEWGEEVLAFVVARPGAPVDGADLDRLCLDRIARFKRPRRYAFIDALPKNNYGKVLKTELRKRDLPD